MIQLYNPGNTDFDKNGDVVLLPEDAGTAAELNGSWTADLTHPKDPEGRWTYIQEEAVVKMPSWNGDQLYRIKKVIRQQDDITVSMYPIFFDSADEVFLGDVRPTNMAGQDALDVMTRGTRYSGESDIDKVTTAYYIDKNLMEAISGDNENAFVRRWGGEIEYDNFTIRINSRLGRDNGVRVAYGKNILDNGITQTIETSGIITRIYPKAYNGRGLSSSFVDSPYISAYPTIKGAVVEYPNIVLAEDAGSSDFDDPTITVCYGQAALDAALIAAAAADFAVGQIDLPAITINVDMAMVGQTQEYVHFYGNNSEPISLGDTVHVFYEPLGIRIDERVTGIEYDSANERIRKVTLGPISADFFDRLNSTVRQVSRAVNSDGTLKAEQLAGVLGGYSNIKSISRELTIGVMAFRMGDMVTLTFNLDLQQDAVLTEQAWTVPDGFRPDASSTYFLGGRNSAGIPAAAALLTVYATGEVYIMPKDSASYTYQDSITYHTADMQPAG